MSTKLVESGSKEVSWLKIAFKDCYFGLLSNQPILSDSPMPFVISTVLLKTQSESDQVRKCAIETLASLILEDYLKFRGSLLLYVLAATADKKSNIARLAHELIIKSANEKNAILIRSCLRECPFAFNDCKLVDNSEMFGSDLSLRSQLKSKTVDRQYIYRVTCKGFKKTPKVLQSIYDFLYICKHMCKAKEIPKTKSAENAGETRSDEEDETPTGSKATPEVMANVSTTNKRNKQQTTLPQAMGVVEKDISMFPMLNDTLVEMDSNFKITFYEMCFAIGEHFGGSIKYVPNSFWNSYQKSKPAKKIRRKNDNVADDDSDENNGNFDQTLPEIQTHKLEMLKENR